MSQSVPTHQPKPRFRGKRKLVLFITFLVSLWLPWVLSLVGCFLSLWIIVPAPTFALLPLGIATPELSPWLVGLNAIALVLVALQLPTHWLYPVALGCSLLGLGLSLVPLLQFSMANAHSAAAMTAEFGDGVLTTPPPIAPAMRPRPFVAADVFRGISIPDVRIERGIPFATVDGVTLTLNLYRPPAIGLHPAIAIIYGGAWKSGTPANDETFSRYMAAQGYTVVALDYRHAPQFRYPVQVEDIHTALAFIQAEATALEIDVQRIAVMGRSAGAHLASLVAYGQSPLPIHAVVNYYGPTNLTEGYNDPPVPDPINTRAVLEDFLGGSPEQVPQLYEAASPVNYIRPNLPPSLLVYPKRDHLVLPRFGQQLYEKLQANGNQAVLLEIPWAEHAFDAVFHGVSNQLALYYTERFLAWALRDTP